MTTRANDEKPVRRVVLIGEDEYELTIWRRVFGLRPLRSRDPTAAIVLTYAQAYRHALTLRTPPSRKKGR